MSLSQGSVISVHAMNTILVIFTRPALLPPELAITLPLFRKSCYSQGNTYTHFREPWGLPGLARVCSTAPHSTPDADLVYALAQRGQTVYRTEL